MGGNSGFMAPRSDQALIGGQALTIRSSVLLLGVGFIVLLGIVVMAYLLAERSRAYFDGAIATRDQRTAAVELRNALLAAESSQRGFAFSGNEVYLAPFETAKSQALRWLAALDRTIATDPDAGPLVERLKIITAEKLSEMDETIALTRERRDDQVMAVFRTNRGKALMDEANIFFSGIILTADDRLTTGIAEQRSNAAWLRLFTIVGGVIIVIVVGFAAASVLSHARELEAAHKTLAALNAGLEARVAERTADLAQANDEIQRFAYIVTHDLRAPLVNIMGFTSELETGIEKLTSVIDDPPAGRDASDARARDARAAASEDLPEAIGFIRSSTRKMDSLINAILKLSRDGRRTLHAETLDLRQAIATAVASVQHQVQQTGGTVAIDIDLPPIQMDRLALDQVVGNLLDNAVKYRAQGRPLAIAIRARPTARDRFVLEIADNGRGIAGHDMDRIFELFRRAGPQDQPGEGMGLAYVKSLVRRLGGTITAQSVLDCGTTFTLDLPTAQHDEQSVPA